MRSTSGTTPFPTSKNIQLKTFFSPEGVRGPLPSGVEMASLYLEIYQKPLRAKRPKEGIQWGPPLSFHGDFEGFLWIWGS